MSPASLIWCLVIIYCSITRASETQDEQQENDEKLLQEGELKLGDQILAILEHFKKDDPVGLPGAKIPDPKEIPDMNHSFSVASMFFKNMNVYGLSKFKIAYVKSEISSMEVKGALVIDSLQILGDYKMSSFFTRAEGPFTVNLTDIYVQGLANLGVERDGKLRAQDINIDITFGKISMDFQNLGFMGSLFQGMINSVGTFLFDSIKPYVLKEAYEKIRTEINDNIGKVSGDLEFSNSISPLDMVISDARKKVRAMKFDPYLLDNYNSSSGVIKAYLANTWIMGISSFYRVGNITLSLANNSVIADFEIGTQRLQGQTQWDVIILGGMISRSGTATFTVEYVNARVIIAQPTDTRKHPIFKDLQLEVGNIQVRCDGAGTVDYVLEFLVNVLPNLLRYQIMDAIEGPLQDKVQEMMNRVEVETIIRNQIPELEKMQDTGFKLSSLKQAEEPPKEEDDDDFWKFD